ncbi:hypothetical protein JZ751_011504 [Albula glossodonta]|uniref:Uncharacterized protein n=1 Tax=Albula glossodonta TaxID=121402 RepID=A0A8T2MZB3_9TELE|nr:hypothetical protein JZ751_011504 [Albula glossodonta]
MTQNALPGLPPPEGMQEEQERPSQNALQEAHCSWMERMRGMGVTAGYFLCLCVISQIMGAWGLYMLNGYGAFPAAHKVLDLMQYLLSPLGVHNSVEEETDPTFYGEISDPASDALTSQAVQRELWRMENLCPLLVTLFLGFVILGIGVSLLCSVDWNGAS